MSVVAPAHGGRARSTMPGTALRNGWRPFFSGCGENHPLNKLLRGFWNRPRKRGFSRDDRDSSSGLRCWRPRCGPEALEFHRGVLPPPRVPRWRNPIMRQLEGRRGRRPPSPTSERGTGTMAVFLNPWQAKGRQKPPLSREFPSIAGFGPGNPTSAGSAPAEQSAIRSGHRRIPWHQRWPYCCSGCCRWQRLRLSSLSRYR